MKRLSFSLCLALLTLSPVLAGQSDNTTDSLVKDMPWRSIGPAVMGGRIDDFAVVESDPSIFYVATAAGGVFKTSNHGTTFESVFDAQPCISIGDVTVAPSNPNVVWVGTGEANNRQSSTWGNGVYKSLDAGKTWTYMGLPESRHIGRIVIDSKNPDIVFVAAGGDLWAPSVDRGVYKTSDGGKTWIQSLAINADTGCTDLAMDPKDPATVYAAMYQRRRTPAGFNGGGPGSGLYKTSDGGAHWMRLEKGLPTGDCGRIGLDVYRKNSSIVYACVENASGGIYRSEDRGESWTKMGTVSMGLNAFRPMYFSQIRIDPNNDQNIVLAGVNIGWSGDGGKTFETFPASRVHPDTHAIWIDPANSKHILVGCDGGIQWTFDQGRTWDHNNILAISQFYEIAYDMRRPYWVYGGLQDNGSWGAPNMALSGRGITNADWINVGGGDGFYCQADPTDSNTVYSESQGGAVARINVPTGERKSIRPPSVPGAPPYRFDWNTPILVSPHNHNRIYIGGNRLFISDDRGDSWRSSPDLTTSPDRTKIPIMGVLPSSKTLSLNDGQDNFGAIVTVSESPAQAGVLWAGTDDGNVQVSRDDGKSWKNVADRLTGVPHGTYVTRVLASAFIPSRAYVTLDGHRAGDFKPYLLVTEDFGETWRSLSGSIPEHYTVKAIREHPRNPSLLFAGTERGAFVSLNRGGAWTKLGSPLPAVPVNDIQIHPRENDLILATHGRGIWVLDDISALEQLADRSVTGSFLLCEPRTAVEYRSNSGQSWGGNRNFYGDNPTPGASLQYFVRTKMPANTTAKLVIMDRNGKQVISEFRSPNIDLGLHRIKWDMRNTGPAAAAAPGVEEREVESPSLKSEEGEKDALLLLGRRLFAACQAEGQTATGGAQQPSAAQTGQSRRGQGAGAGAQGGGGRVGGAGDGGGGGGRGGGFGPRVLPGTYLLRMTIGSEEQTREIKVEDDPRVHISDRDRRALYDQQLRVMRLSQSYADARRSIATLRMDVAALQKASDKAPEAVKQALADLDKEIRAALVIVSDGRRTPVKPVEKPAETGQATESGQPVQGPTQAGAVLQRLNRLSGSVNSITEPLSKYQRQEADALADVIRQIVDVVNGLHGSDVAHVNKMLAENKLKPLSIPPTIVRPR